jgi:SAM-dependent methyltransferase
MLDLLAPVRGERILDVGCGTGQLTAAIAEAGAEVVGIDSSAAMVDQARANYPKLRFEQHDVRALPYEAEFDAVFSNAVLHWVHEADAAVRSIARALKPGGRFVAEFGGHGNTAALLEAVSQIAGRPVNPWYYPSIGEYAAVLEANGLEPTFAVLFDRPTPLEGGPDGLKNWLQMFGSGLRAAAGDRTDFAEAVARLAAPKLCKDGAWTMDYRRLRIVGRRSTSAAGRPAPHDGRARPSSDSKR